LQEFDEEYSSLGLRTAIVSKDTELTIAQVEPFFTSHEYTLPVLYDPDLVVSKNWGVETIPTTFLISPDGEILRQEVGFICTETHAQHIEWQQAIHQALLGEELPEAEIIELELYSADEGCSSGMTEEERKDYERDAEYVWRKFLGKCKHRYIYEIDSDMARYDFEIIDEGITDTKHGRQPYHVWFGIYEYSDRQFEVEVWLASGRGDWHFYRVSVDGAVWGEY